MMEQNLIEDHIIQMSCGSNVAIRVKICTLGKAHISPNTHAQAIKAIKQKKKSQLIKLIKKNC